MKFGLMRRISAIPHYHINPCFGVDQIIIYSMFKDGYHLWSLVYYSLKGSKCAKIRNQYNQVPHLTQNTNEKVTNSLLDTTNESQEVSPFPAGDHKAHINRHAQRHSKHKTEQKHK